MSSHYWCHGPSCHTYTTSDRVRGSKGSKVLRTRKIKTTTWNKDSFYRFFCSTGCYNDFAMEHAEQIIRIAPRNEPLETKIEDPKKTEHSHTYSDGSVHKWYSTEINKVDTTNDVG